MKVLHLISSGGMYGAESMLLNLASSQRRLGCEAVIGVFENRHRPHLEVAEEARRRGLPVVVISCAGRFDRRPLEVIGTVIRECGVTLVHGHGYKSNLYGYFSAISENVRFVATCHLWTRATLRIRLYEYVDSFVLRRADKVVGVSEGITKTLRECGVAHAKSITISNGTDFSRYTNAPATLRAELGIGKRPLIGTVGRLEEQKGIEYFIRAARGVLRVFPDAVFAVIGEGVLRPRLTKLIGDLGLESSVRLLGERNDMPGVYASLDIFVLASIAEGMPMTILEALSAKRPVIATRVGDVGKLILPDETGLLIEARDPAALENAVLRYLRQRDFAGDLARRGEALVQRLFSADSMAQAYINLYDQLCSRIPSVLSISIPGRA